MSRDQALIQIRSYAKINWRLDVLGRREDGFHELRTVLQTVSLYDTLRISPAADRLEIACNDPQVPVDETNLVYKAAAALARRAGLRPAARISIEKRIPVAAGLGGGSSNAAAALEGLRRFWSVRVGPEELIEIASGLGSDVPFFLMGGTALGVGRGEEVYPLEEVDCPWLVLANPGIAVSTAEAYKKLSRLTRKNPARIMPFALIAAKGIRELPLAATNDLEQAVLAAHPEIAEVKQRLLALGAGHALMSGSGATVFGVFDNEEASRRAATRLRASGCWAAEVRAIDRPTYRETLFED
ncbi:MAG TPA: 4-(cytidine 5'-diphospho)-2-C-methyl-D-erythritol kinase [Blastocatellia bacterium]|nr:4-(cytidine 5'-diphospho)-2-C-methyl-D-erythritol kinase [Blastocatellia bacterium]